MPYAAVSPLTRDLVCGGSRPMRPARVLADLTQVVYLAVGDRVLPMERPGGIGLPTALRVSTAFPAVTGAVEVGQGRVRLGDTDVVIAREWRPSRVRPTSGLEPDDDLLRRSLASVGRGPGLTPEADDVLCGVLLIAYAAAGPVCLPHQLPTTDLSASLIRAAAQGYAVEAVVRYADAAIRGVPTQELAAPVRALGHSSGAALLEGIDRAVCSTTKTTTSERSRRMLCPTT